MICNKPPWPALAELRDLIRKHPNSSRFGVVSGPGAASLPR
jgi:hypothetical protein